MNERLLAVRNRQRRKRVDTARLGAILRGVLEQELRLPQYELSVQLVSAREMARINERFLHHQGPTDVVTFHYGSGPNPLPRRVADRSGPAPKANFLHGDIIVCVDVAIAQAGTFKTNWNTELVRYSIHGILHLIGYDDKTRAARLKMKRRENQLVRSALRTQL